MDSSPVFFAHANGFPARCYDVFFEELAPHPISYIDIIGKEVKRPQNWEEIGDEIIRFIEQQQYGPVTGLGHSFGGVGVFFAARKRPDLFSRIIVLDPPFFGWKRRWLAAPFQVMGLAKKVVPPAKKALKRRDWFEDRAEARDYLSEKRFFQTFHPRAFDDYLTHGLTDMDGKVTLTISKEKEAEYFSVFPSRIGSTALEMDAHYVVPKGTAIAPVSMQNEIKKRFDQFTWHETPGNHMFPLEHPTETAGLIRNILET